MQDHGWQGRPQSSMKQVYQLHEDLMHTINEMDEKIEEVIEQHTAEFLLAYRNHIKTMKEELTSMRDRAEQQEKKMLSNDRGIFLQKQLILFREEALKLYDKLQEKTHENEINKSKMKQIERGLFIFEKQNKELLRHSKNLEAILETNQNKLDETTKETEMLKQELRHYKQQQKQYLTRGQTNNTDQQTREIRNQYLTSKETLNHPNISLNSKFQIKPRGKRPSSRGVSNKFSTVSQQRSLSSSWMDHELKNWFLECLQTIRREVVQRKMYDYKSEDINKIQSWEDFRMVDKLRLLQMFMHNEKLLVWMYEKIFPTRINQIEGYLTSKKPNPFEARQKSKSMNIQLQHMSLLQLDQSDINPPQFIAKKASSKLRSKKYDVLGRIEMRNGKLNLSQAQGQNV